MSKFAGDAAHQFRIGYFTTNRHEGRDPVLNPATGSLFERRRGALHMFELGYGLLLARRALLSASILIASCCAAFAQSETQAAPPANGPAAGEAYHGRGVERELNQLSRILSLTDDQKTQVKTILESQRQQMEQLRSSAGQANGAAQPDRTQFQAIRQDTKTKIEALLNDEQKAKYEAWLQQREQRMEQRRGGEGEQGPPNSDGV
jgi:periplasmic protein CpxP/Spy